MFLRTIKSLIIIVNLNLKGYTFFYTHCTTINCEDIEGMSFVNKSIVFPACKNVLDFKMNIINFGLKSNV